MYISQIKFRMNVEVAPFKHEHVEVTAELDEGDDENAAFDKLKTRARGFLGVNVTQDDVDMATTILARAKRAGL